MEKDLENALKDCGLLGTIGGGYKSRVLIAGEGSDLAQAYATPLANELQRVTGDRILCSPLLEGLVGAITAEYDTLSFQPLKEGDKALGADSRPLVDLVHLVITGSGTTGTGTTVLPNARTLYEAGIAVVVTHLDTMGSIAEMKQHQAGLWPVICEQQTVVNITFQHVDELIYGTRPKDRGRAVLSGWGVMPATQGELLERASPSPRLGMFVERELTTNRVGYLIQGLTLAAKAGWDVVLITPGLSDIARRAIEKLLVEDGLQTDVEIIDKEDLSSDALLAALASCDATVWLPDGEHALGQDWRVAVGAAARKPLLLLPNPRTVGYREDPMGASAFCWADTGAEEIASMLYGMDPTTQDGAGPHAMWAGRVSAYADARSWAARGEEVLVAYAKAMELVDEKRMQRVLQNFPKRR